MLLLTLVFVAAGIHRWNRATMLAVWLSLCVLEYASATPLANWERQVLNVSVGCLMFYWIGRGLASLGRVIRRD